MKKITVIALIIVAAMLLNFAQSFAQTSVKATKQGNTLIQDTSPKTAAELTSGATKTDYTFQTKDGDKLPVWKSATGKFFVLRTSASSGNLYRQYITIQE
jgi:hypothetical protein